MIEDLANLIPPELREMSGSVFYSGRRAYRSGAALYLLGLNPGGCPGKQRAETIAWHTHKVLKTEPDDWSAYRDESWNGNRPGSSVMQRRVLHLFLALGLQPGDVPASNLVFVRSRRESDIKHTFLELAARCWVLHAAALEKLKPKVIVCFGKNTGNYVRHRLHAGSQVSEFVEQNERKWKSRSYVNHRGLVVAVLTHPSIADWTSPATDPSCLVQEALEGRAA